MILSKCQNLPTEITPGILKSIVSISEKIGEVNTRYLIRQDPTLKNKIRLKPSMLHYKLREYFIGAQITAILENKG